MYLPTTKVKSVYGMLTLAETWDRMKPGEHLRLFDAWGTQIGRTFYINLSTPKQTVDNRHRAEGGFVLSGKFYVLAEAEIEMGEEGPINVFTTKLYE